MDTVHKLLDTKGRDVWSIALDASVFEAIELMAEKGCGALLVMQGRELVGIISERDYARKVILAGRSSKSTRVRDIMSSPVVTADPSHKVEQCLSMMTDKRIRHLPVLENKKVVGVISIGDVVKEMLSEQAMLIQQLESYIHS